MFPPAPPLLLLLFLLPHSWCHGATPYPACPAGLTCGQLAPYGPDMVYDCAYAHPLPGSNNNNSTVLGNVYLLHGDDGFRSKAMWAEVMLQLAGAGYASLACDQRGYSPGASPPVPEAYHYDLLAADILALTTAAGFNSSFGGKFHIVAHDQGARIAWHSIAKGMTRDHLLSFSSLSIPHADVFSDNVMGPHAVEADQTAEQYLRQLTLNHSVTVNGNALMPFCDEFGFDTPAACQPSFWWYNGAIDSGNMAMAPLMPFKDSIASKVNIPYSMVQALTPYPLTGVPQTVKVGPIRADEFPVFFACGRQDTCDLCEDRVVQQTAQMIQSPFSSVINACGHKLISPDKCTSEAERQKVIDGILANVAAGHNSQR